MRLLLLYFCGRCICHYSDRGICCCGCVDANESSLITLVHSLSLEIGKILNFNQFKECISDGQADGRTDELTDYPSSIDARTNLKTLLDRFH